MKKFFTLIIAVVAISVNAQSDKGDFTIAPQAGLNLSNYTSSENLNNKIRVAFNAGVVTEYYFSDRWSLRSGLIYDSKGTKLEEGSFNLEEKLNYLVLPVHANWHFGSNRNWYLNFGPSFGFLLSAKADENGQESDIKDLVNSFDLGLGLGIGYKFNMDDRTQFFIEYQGYNGFINIAEESDINLLNATSAFNIGVIFRP
ncbi:porin family protein [Winogradskyella maritima]|uniref:Porin family protein n=1 Tax=Winogradskyella maritima TaxID=1517766 RepID=A0ABV8AHI2_9FLAO|nr:porin family protein [Winogradskyella maritima]